MSEFTYAFDSNKLCLIETGNKVLTDNGEHKFDCIMIELSDFVSSDCRTILAEANRSLSDNGVIFMFYRDIEQFLFHFLDAKEKITPKLNPAKYMTSLYLNVRNRSEIRTANNLYSGIDRVIAVFAKGYHVENHHSIIDHNKKLVINDKYSTLIEGDSRSSLQDPMKRIGGDIFSRILGMFAPHLPGDTRKKWDHVLVANFERPTLHEIKKFGFDIGCHFVFAESSTASITEAKIKAAINDISLSFHNSCPSQQEINNESKEDDEEDGYMAENDGQLRFA